MSLENLRLQDISRRHFLKNCQIGLGAIALSSMLSKDCPAGPSEATDPLASKSPPFCAKGHAGHLLAPDRLAAALGSVRLQAGTGEDGRQALSGRVHFGKTVCFYFRNAQVVRHTAQVHSARSGRNLDVGCNSPFAQGGGRPVCNSFDAHGSVQSCPRRTAGLYRISAPWSSVSGFLGNVRPWIRK